MKLSVKSGVQRFYSVKSLLQIGDNVVDVLRTDRKTDGVVKNLLLVKLLRRQLGVGGGLGVDHQGLYICHIGQQREDLQRVDKGLCLFFAAFDVKGEDGTAGGRRIVWPSVPWLRRYGPFSYWEWRFSSSMMCCGFGVACGGAGERHF